MLRRFRVDLGAVLFGSGLFGCGELLGIPSEPRLAESMPAPNIGSVDAVGAATPPRLDMGDDAVTTDDGAVPIRVGSTDEPIAVSVPGTGEPAPGRFDAGVLGSADGGIQPVCSPGEPLQSAPVDIVLVLDNSGSMPEETDAVERSLAPSFAAVLDAAEVDYRIILLSRHRAQARTASEAASTSICVANPLGGLASCPSAAPVLSERFFHYSVKIDATDSFDRLLATYAEPDAFGLAELGWSEWLRNDALKVLIEISDADADLPLAQFLERLSVLGPEHFGGDPSQPRFVFHSLIGLREKGLVTASYLPSEPIETRTCSSTSTDPDNAGQSYQELSRSTGGLRLPLCPSTAIGVRLSVLAADTVLRSARACE